MKNSSSRILTTHIGSLARPPEILEILRAKEGGQSYHITCFSQMGNTGWDTAPCCVNLFQRLCTCLSRPPCHREAEFR